MPLPRSAGAARRRQRGVRVTVAVSLLLVATLVVIGALVLASPFATSAAAVVALLCGAVSTRIVFSELAQSRRESARERAIQAHAYQQMFAERVVQEQEFAATMTERIIRRDEEIGRLLATSRVAGRRAELAEETAEREARRNVELQGLLDAAVRELNESEESLATWDGSVPVVVDLLAWEERAASAGTERPESRRRA